MKKLPPLLDNNVASEGVRFACLDKDPEPVVFRPHGDSSGVTFALNQSTKRMIQKAPKSTETGGERRSAPLLEERTVQSIIRERPARQAICWASSSPSISLFNSSGSEPSSTTLPSRCTAWLFIFKQNKQAPNKVYLALVNADVEQYGMHTKRHLCAHFITRAAKVDLETCVNLVLDHWPVNVNVGLVMVAGQVVQLVLDSTE